MSDTGDTTWIGTATGQTHTGSGTQNIYYVTAEGLHRRGADPLRMALDRRRWLSSRFVPPSRYGDAVGLLEDPGTAVLVSGVPGSGGRTAGVVLLHRMGRDADPFREVALDDKRDEPAVLADGERVLIDLSSVSEQDLVGAQVQVKSYWNKVERCGGRLAVVLPRQREHFIESDLRQLLVRIGRPDGGAVMARHLLWAGIEVPLPELRRSALGKVLERSSMADLQRLSELVAEARSLGGAFGLWARKAVDALRERGPEVAGDIAALTDGRQRALLFTAAMLDEGPADAAFQLSADLLTKLGHPEDDRPRLDRTDLTQRLRELKVEVNERRIHFEALAYGPAVRSHFWLYYPDLRTSFGAWVDEAVRDTRSLEPADRRTLVSRYTEQALRVGDVGTLTDLVESWAKETRFLPEALSVLDQGLRDEQAGAAFRTKIYSWSMDPRLHPNLVRGLARICSDVMAVHHPDQALVRLHQLARREAGSQRDARAALLELVRRDRRLYRLLLGRLRDGMDRAEPWRPDAGIFVELVVPPPTNVRRDDVVGAWRGALTVVDAGEWAPGVKAWLSAARQEPDGGSRLVGILIEAAGGSLRVLSHLYLLADTWAAEPDDTPGLVDRAAVAALFRREIDRAQGIEPFDLASAGATEGSSR
ncbi:hypothetical protein [Kitasatospora cinereorecta]|uniref:Uncharacterized protein n=1 Tax=Kitasatospora cinereorecta TaxID=285560 RepID=A0ABW0VDC3_9ACTN